ncbi:SMI1/KNR4 family protein [Chitinophaga flava]|uniref:Knr4/Smi1-like domain-containing protein n=1 Tax=Chitinophaga flava TaxID=2259036 RepID=A0A365XTV1_9BACT|nr:SMI1/KNR4 family protein [Chitinophaga flava]RBL89763.1 hypothetical protein DF182_25060 [Chitinophaga flava]
MIIEQIEHKIGKKLPESYKNLLRGINDYCYISYNEFREEFPGDAGTSWFFWGEKRLDELSVIEGVTENRKAWEVLKSYSEINEKTGKNMQGRFLDHLNSFISIAEDNGDILYLDAKDNFSVWIYMHDSGESKYLELSFDAWIIKASIDQSI